MTALTALTALTLKEAIFSQFFVGRRHWPLADDHMLQMVDAQLRHGMWQKLVNGYMILRFRRVQILGGGSALGDISATKGVEKRRKYA